MMHFARASVLAVLLHLWASAGAAPPFAGLDTDSATLNLVSEGFNFSAPVNTTLLEGSSSKALNVSNRDFPDPYDMVVGNHRLTIEFYGYQDVVNFTDLDLCVSDANADIIQKFMAGQGSAPMGAGPYVWSSGDVALYLSPGELLTWNKWSLVPVLIYKFIVENRLRGTQFVILWHELGPVGYGQLVAASETLSLETMTRANAFPDPYDKVIVSVGLTIEFYGYRGEISPIAMRDCISAASNDVVWHLLASEVPMNMEAPSYSYSADGVNLFLSPGDNLTWHMWAFVPIWIQEFVTENEFKGTQFVLLWEAFGIVGFGQLTNISTGGLSKVVKARAPRMI